MTLDDLIGRLQKLRAVDGNRLVLVEIESDRSRRLARASSVGFVTVIAADERADPHVFRVPVNSLDEKDAERTLAVVVR